MKASIFYRVAAVLLLLFAVGHTIGFRESDPTWGVDTLLGSMRSIHFDVQGFSRTYWDLFVAAGFLGRRVLSIRGGISVAARWPSGRDFGGHARHGVGFRSLLCRHHGCELGIPLYPPNRFFNRDYSVFDCGGMAFSEANLKPFVRVCSSLPGEPHPYSAFWRFPSHSWRMSANRQVVASGSLVPAHATVGRDTSNCPF